tara:strand:+ start:601 stop:1797 length:1197 start_codon:yes stop_codon:yes gene_type:complete
MSKPWITIIGINQDDINTLNKSALKALSESEIIFGAERNLQKFLNFKNKCFLWPNPFKNISKVLKKNRGRKIVLLVSGNAFWFGLGTLIASEFKKEEWQCFQAPSSFSLASAEMGWSMENVLFFGLHAKNNETLRPFMAPKIKFIILLKEGKSVESLTNFFTNEGFGDSKFTIFESLGHKLFKKRNTIAKTNNIKNINHPVCVAIETLGDGIVVPKNSGKPDYFFINDGQITKQYIRSITLSALSPMPFEHLWDLGSGSGSISIEWLLSDKTTSATAVEINKKRVGFIKKNCKALGVDRVIILNDDMNQIIRKLKKPDAVFIGGGLNERLFKKIWNLIPVNTRVVVNSVTIETESCINQLCKIYGGKLLKIELSNVRAVGKSHAWSNNFPIVQWKIIK